MQKDKFQTETLSMQNIEVQADVKTLTKGRHRLSLTQGSRQIDLEFSSRSEMILFTQELERLARQYRGELAGDD